MGSGVADAGPSYCPPGGVNRAQPAVPVLARQPNPDGMNALIQRFAPVLYLAQNEPYLPIRAEEYFTHSSTVMKGGRGPDIPAGQVTMKAIYERFAQAGRKSTGVSFETAECAKYGSNPAHNSAGGVLRTPIYAIAFENGGQWYVHYVFYYGYNGEYQLQILGKTLPKSVGGQHWADAEHVTIRLDRAKQAIDQIYFAAHGGDDGMLFKGGDLKQLEWEGTRPVVYSALNGHGSYPRAGLWVRIASFGSDVTSKGMRWDPEIVRIFPDVQPWVPLGTAGKPHPHFDPATMGWIYAPGNLGKDGIASVAQKDWFLNPAAEKPAFKPLEHWCASASEYACMLKKLGGGAQWKPIREAIEGFLKSKVVAPLKSAAEKAKEAAKSLKKKLGL